MSGGTRPTAGRHPEGRRDLGALFDPRSVAVVGASADGGKYGRWLASQAIRMERVRPVHLVNRRGGQVLGRTAFRDLRDLPDGADLVAVTVPADAVEDVVDTALDVGARAIVCVTSGFAERDDGGRAAQERLTARVREAGAVLVGPNCLGLVDVSTSLTLTSNPMPVGRVALLSQSGNLALEVSNRLAACGHGLSRFVSLGNQADVDVADLVRDCARHDQTDVIAVYCEDFRDGRRFVAAAVEAVERGKAVLLLTVGVSGASVRGARSHTASLTTSSRVVDAACEAGGIHRVRSPRDLVHAATALVRHAPGSVRRLAVVSDGGGHASLASDVAEAAGVSVPVLGDALRRRLVPLLPASARVENPVDLGSGAGSEVESFACVTGELLADEEVDAVLVTGYFGGYAEYGPEMAARERATARRLTSFAEGTSKPLVVHTMFPTGAVAEDLRAHGVPVFSAVEDATDYLRVLVPAARPQPQFLPPDPLAAAAAAAAAAPLTDDGYGAARALVAEAGIRFPAARLVGSVAEVIEAGRELSFPLVLKATGLLHKSDVGGVALALTSPAELAAVAGRMERTLAPSGYSVEAMADRGTGVELIVGAQRDPRFGVVVTVGLGGVLTEALDDVCHALAPVDHDWALALLGRLRSARILAAYRGRPALDTAAVARALVVVGDLLIAHPELAELEVNPLLVSPAGALALDARVVLGAAPTPPDPTATEEEAWTSV